MQTATKANLTNKKKKSKKGAPDFVLLGLIVLIVAFGVVMVYSASYDYARNGGRASHYFASKQLVLGLLGIAVMLWVTFKFDYHICTNRRLVTGFYIISLLLAVSVKFIGIEANGAKRWIGIGPIQIQPSELVKLAVVLMVTSYIIRNRSTMNKLKTRLVAWCIVGVPFLIVTILGSNLSSGIVILGIGAMIIFSASPRIWYYFAFLFAGLGLVFAVRQLAINTPKGEDTTIPIIKELLPAYRIDRIRAWTDPFSDPQEDGYQSIQALYAVGSGGLFGRGLSKGVQKLGFLPEPYNDIIFAVICEELGLVGALVLMLAYGIIVMRGMAVAMRAPDYSGAFIAIGISSMIGIQAIINIAVNTNTIPTTGMQLPLVSYGGTALVVLLSTLGLLLNISRYSSVQKLD
ncbi:MAG: FtsW/RodA/SpoVE family cell cycle protein [Cellulosilyticum sp.]|nr:FtsW/RodA/SpoVE family cell cycle protein [Cellulosilyticum sp.]